MAKRYVETALDYSKDIAIGNGFQGPFDHLLKFKSDIRNSFRQQAFNPENLFLYAVTDSGMNKKWGRSITDAVKAAIEGGATIVQLRFVMTDGFSVFRKLSTAVFIFSFNIVSYLQPYREIFWKTCVHLCILLLVTLFSSYLIFRRPPRI